jgi:hypothetical protein
VTELDRDGRAVLAGKMPGHGDRTVSWTVAGDELTRALRMTIHQPLSTGPAQFVTRVTVSQSGEGGGLRIVMGREIPDGWIAPVQDPPLKRPNLLRAVLGDEQLEVRVLSQLATGRYERIREESHADVLLDVLALRTRLPILLMHPRDQAGWSAAADASGQLAGLAQVVTLNYVTAQAVRRAHEQVAVPSGGARLVWPDLGLEHPAYSREEVSQTSFVERRLMPSLAHLSVIARGSDTAWERARQASYRAGARRAAEQLSRAQAAGDTTAELEALQKRVRQLEEDATSWEDMAQSCMEERDKARDDAATAEALRQDRDYWKNEYLNLSKGGSGQAATFDAWSEIPPLGTDAVPTFEALAKAHRVHGESGARLEGLPLPVPPGDDRPADRPRAGCDGPVLQFRQDAQAGPVVLRQPRTEIRAQRRETQQGQGQALLHVQRKALGRTAAHQGPGRRLAQ